MFDTVTDEEQQQLQIHIGTTVTQVWSQQVSIFQPDGTWSPPVNIYQLARRIDVCVDLAGVEPGSVEVRVSPGQLVIRGVRHTPDPRHDDDDSIRIVSMEIDHGRFHRSVPLPDTIDVRGAATEFAQGLMWIRLPLRPEA